MAKINPDRLLVGIQHARDANTSDYLHWDDVLHRKAPADLTAHEWWAGIKLSRQSMFRETPLRDPQDVPFKYTLPDLVLAHLHRLDQVIGGQITISETVTNPALRDRYVVSSLIEEAITSSQLEGASTTGKVARDMIRTGRPPRDKSEQMILNNYRAMRRILQIAKEPLTPELVLDLHRIVTEETLDDPDAAGRLQSPDDERVKVWDESGHPVVLHSPPPAHMLPDRLVAMCAFANEADEDARFLHPVLRAIILHFWLAYDHPFEDGNGRTARALFYWCMLSRGYWLAEFLSISSIIRKGRAKYDRSFLYTETDDNDLTYFALTQLRVIARAVAELRSYLERKQQEVREAERLLRADSTLNHRQIAVVSRALRDPDARFTISSHRRSHNVVYQTARTDLLDLEARRLLTRAVRGNTYVFRAADGLSDRLSAA